MNTERKEQIEALVESISAEHNLVPIEVIIRGSDKRPVFEIYVDGKESVTFELCTAVSRAIDEQLEKILPEGTDYRLDVSSPGVSRPLLYAWQYHKHIGRTLEIVMADGTKKKGVLTAADEATITLEEQQKKRKKGEAEEENAPLAFADIQEATVVPQW